MPSPATIYRISTPLTHKISFDHVFRNVEKQTEEDLRQLSYVRDEVVIALERASADAAIKAIERYMPHLGGLMIAASTVPPENKKSLKVSWTTPLSIKHNTSHLSMYGSLNFEYVMLLLTYGIMHRNAACDILVSTSESEYEEKSKVIANLLCKSAGVFDFVRGELYKWLPKPEGLYAEFLDETYVALSSLSLAEAQHLAIKKAVLKNTSGSITAKLCVDVAHKCEQSAVILRSLATPSENILVQLDVYFSLSASIFKSLAAKYLGEEANKNGKFGLSIGFMVVASSHLTEQLFLRSKNMPALANFIAEARVQQKDAERLFNLYTNDNNTIYFEKVAEGHATALPEGKSITKGVPFTPPQPTPFTITIKEGYSCVLQ